MGLFHTLYYYGMYLFNYSASQGARASLHAALDPDFNTEPALQGAYLHVGNPWNPQEPTIVDPSTNEPYVFEAYAKTLYEITEGLIAKLYKK